QFDAAQWEGFGAGESRLETFKRCLERYKCEFRIAGNVIYLERQIGRDTQFHYRHRLNSTNIEEEIDATEMWNYTKGNGNYKNQIKTRKRKKKSKCELMRRITVNTEIKKNTKKKTA